MLLFGNYDISIDNKNRLLIPSEIRKATEQAKDSKSMFVTIGVDRKLWLYPAKYYESVVSRLRSELTPGDEENDFDLLYFGMTTRVDLDGQGRILLPETLLTFTSTGREVTAIGARDHVTIWNRDEWRKRSEELMANRQAVTSRAKQLRSEQP